ncbi:MAG TPA: helix-turn-helix transcriptional regulator [Polyangiaceae bacterium]|nr:helix-turn-helix transcriptional regulator [Polyangiaceae bacterium]
MRRSARDPRRSSATRKPEYRRFLARLRAAREAAGMTQEAVAVRLKVRQSYVSKCESGERRVDVIDLAKFARLYRKSLPYFVSG